MKDIGYKILSPFVKLKFILTYKPLVLGKEKIPSLGPLIICGNHRHKDDQYNVLIHTNRVVHFMAKDEYFKGKKAWFYRMAGCIPVDRTKKDEMAKSEAQELLLNGECVGLFPEGTRNDVLSKQEKIDELYNILFSKMTKEELLKLLKNKNIKFTQVNLLVELKNKNIITKEELENNVLDADNYLKKLLKENKITKETYNESLLLPFKFGAVSLASKTNALILPFATIGDYNKKKGSLITKIGTPFSIKDMDLESANKLLRKKIIELMQND